MANDEINNQKKQFEVDIYRDTFARYMGYSNEVGEAFRPLVQHSLVAGSYGIAIGYVCLDAFDKGHRMLQKGADRREVALISSDVLLWQILASVIIPGYTINRITWLGRLLIDKTNVNRFLKRSAPTALGLVSIPLIVGPIDRLVDHLMDITFRKWIHK